MKIKNGVRRSLYVFGAISLTVATVFSGIVGHASAATQITSRSITMANSNQGTSGVSYKITFTPAASYTAKSIVVDFCDNDPLPGDSCTLPTGFSVTGSPAVDNAASSPRSSSVVGRSSSATP